MSWSRVVIACGVMLAASAGASPRATRLFAQTSTPRSQSRTVRAPETSAPAAGPPSGTVRRVWWGKDLDAEEGSPSPDGRLFAFTDWENCGDLAVRDVERGTSRRLTNLKLGADGKCSGWVEYSVFSPDARQIAAGWAEVRHDSIGYGLRIVGLDSTAPRAVVPAVTKQLLVPQDWTPDGKNVVFVVSRDNEPPQIATVAAAGGAPRTLKTFTEWRSPFSLRVRVSPDGRFIAYSFPSFENDGRHDIHLLSIADGRDVTLFKDVAADYVVGWSADGAALLFGSDRGGSPWLWSVRVANGRPARTPQRIRGEMWRAEAIRPTTSGSVFYLVRSGDSDIYATSIDLSTGKFLAEPKGISQHPGAPHGYPAWSLDGKYVAFSTPTSPVGGEGSQVVTIRPLEGGDVRQFRPRVAYVSALVWMPNMQALLLRAQNGRDRRDELLRLDLKTGDVREFISPFRGLPIFSRDGRWMYYMASDADRQRLQPGDHSRIVAREMTTGKERVIYTPPEGYLVFGAAAMTPIYCLTADERSVVFPIANNETPRDITDMRIVSAPIDGGPPRQLFAAPAGDSLIGVRVLGLSADGGHVMFLRFDRPPRKASLWRVPVSGGPAEAVAPERAEFPTLMVAPDRRHAAFLRGTTEQELWVLDGADPRDAAQKPDGRSRR